MIYKERGELAQLTMTHLNLGEVIDVLMKYKGVSVEELVKNICSVEDMLLFQSNKKYPTIEQLNKFAEKLNVDINYFFNLSSSGSFDYSISIINLIEKYKRKRNYKEIYNIIINEKENPAFLNRLNRQYLVWHEGICIFYLKRNKCKAISILNQAIDITNPLRKNLTEREIEILTSIAIIEKDDLNYSVALDLFIDAYNYLKQLPHIIDPRVTLKVLYALSQLLTRLKRYEDSLMYCLEGISVCRNYEQLYLFGEFYYQTGENYIRIGDKEKGREYIDKSINIFELQNNTEYVELVKKELEYLLG